MKRSRVAICDPEQVYAYRLTDALSRDETFPFEVVTFTSAKTLLEGLAEAPVQLLLIAARVYFAEEENLHAAHILLLWEEDAPVDVRLPGISKYTSVAGIRKKILEAAAETGSMIPALNGEHSVQILGIYSPVHRCLQTTFSFVTGQVLARSYRVLYLNLEPCSGLSEMLGHSFESDFSELLYYLQEPCEVLLSRLCRMTENISNGMDMLPPIRTGTDILKTPEKEWQKLLDVLQKSGYDYVILDLSDCVQGLYEILRRCSRVYTIVREDAFAQAKLTQYEEQLARLEFGDVLQKTQKCRLPVFQRLPRNLCSLAAGELAAYVEGMFGVDGQRRI